MDKTITAVTGMKVNQENGAMPTIGHNNPPVSLNDEGQTLIDQQNKLNKALPPEKVLTSMEAAQTEVIAAARDLVSYKNKGETVLSKLALACLHLIQAKVEQDGINASAWRRTNVVAMRNYVRSFIKEQLKGKDEDAIPGQRPASNATFDAYVGEAVELACMALLNKHGIHYSEQFSMFMVPSNSLYKTTLAPDPTNPAKTIEVENTSTTPIRVIRSMIKTLFYGSAFTRIVDGKTIKGWKVEPAFPAEAEDEVNAPNNGVQKPKSNKGRKPKKQDTVTADNNTDIGHTVEAEPISIAFTKPDGSASVQVDLTPQKGTTNEQMERAKALVKEPIVALAAALQSVLGARLSAKALGDLSSADRNALSELAQILDQVETRFGEIDKANEQRSRKVA